MAMTTDIDTLHVEFAKTDEDLQSLQRLRHDVFVQELGAQPGPVGHLEKDKFDIHARHLILRDRARPKNDQIVGTYRLMDSAAAKPCGFSSESEYDLGPLYQSGKRLLELGRSCMHPDYRGGRGMFLLWQALSQHIEMTGAETLFGVASFHGTDSQRFLTPLSLLHYLYRADVQVRPVSRKPPEIRYQALDQFDRKEALLQMPPLIKAYLRLGGQVGEGAFVDHTFNTIDVCMVLQMDRVSERQRAIYAGVRG